MSPTTANQLWDDLQEWGAVALASSRDQMRRILGTKRGDRLHAWVREHGTADPRKHRPAPKVAPVTRTTWPTHLVIGDAHAGVDQSLHQFEWFGRMVAELKPTTVVSLADWYDLPSLCEHRTLAERVKDRTVEELRAGEMAVERFEAAAAGWSGRKVITWGNHDERINRLYADAPWLEGLVDATKAHKRHGWEVFGFLQPARVDGVRYQHYLPAVGGRKAISGKFHSLRLLERVKFGESVAVGHSHRLDHRVEAVGTKRVHGLVVGCAFGHHEEYAGEDNNEWWRGICVLHDVRDGDFDLETWSLERIRARWG